MPKDKLRAVLKELYAKLERIYGKDLYKAILYGSYARGDYDEYSDIDVMVLVECGEDEIKKLEKDLNFIGSRMGLEYDVMISLYARNREHFDRWREHMPYYRNIVAEGVEISA